MLEWGGVPLLGSTEVCRRKTAEGTPAPLPSLGSLRNVLLWHWYGTCVFPAARTTAEGRLLLTLALFPQLFEAGRLACGAMEPCHSPQCLKGTAQRDEPEHTSQRMPSLPGQCLLRGHLLRTVSAVTLCCWLLAAGAGEERGCLQFQSKSHRLGDSFPMSLNQ